MTATIALSWMGSPTDELWETILRISDKARARKLPWMLIGGQMVLLHALEHGREPMQISQNADVIASLNTHEASSQRLSE